MYVDTWSQNDHSKKVQRYHDYFNLILDDLDIAWLLSVKQRAIE
jgi:hypothetical protein